MSYKTELSSNNTDLQTILNTVNTLPEATTPETPIISVNSSGLITATANNLSATKQLSSSDDSDFVAGNIANGVTIFGITGTLTSSKAPVFEQNCSYTVTTVNGTIYFNITTSQNIGTLTGFSAACWLNGVDSAENWGVVSYPTTGQDGWMTISNGQYGQWNPVEVSGNTFKFCLLNNFGVSPTSAAKLYAIGVSYIPA